MSAPTDVTTSRVATWFHSQGMRHVVSDGAVRVSLEGFDLVVECRAPDLLVATATWRGLVPGAQEDSVRAHVDAHNGTRLGPSAVLRGQGQELRLVARSGAFITHGMTDAQLRSALGVAVETLVVFFDDVAARFPSLVTWPVVERPEREESTTVPFGNRDAPPPVTLARVMSWFESSGLAYDLDGEDGTVDSVLDSQGTGYEYAVAIPGRERLHLRGVHWAGLPSDEETSARVRGVLNDMNDAVVFPTLSTFTDDDGLHVRADIVLDVYEGMSQAQLDQALGTGAAFIRGALDHAAGVLAPAPEDVSGQ